MIKSVWVGTGMVFVGVGILGFFIPLMPSLVFFLIATYCFARGSWRFLRRIIGNKHIGQQIIDYHKGRGMTVKTKVRAIVFMLVSMVVSAFFLVEKDWVRIAIIVTAVGVVFIILGQKTKKAG
ncbi:MAG: YbaN family protein [Bacteroidota bacterium]